jgi:hypothetical protein
MIKTSSQQIKNGDYSDNFISIAGNITHVTATITEAPHTSSITPGIACLLHTAIPCVCGKVTMFPHLPFNELFHSPTYLHISPSSYLHSILNNPSYTKDPTSNPHQTTVQAIRKSKEHSDQAI